MEKSCWLSLFIVFSYWVACTAFETSKKESAKADEEEGTFPFTLEHNLSGTFTPREKIELHFSSLSTRGASVKFSGYKLTTADQTKLQKLAESNDFYRVRLVDSARNIVHASVPACALITSGLRESFTFHIDSYGNVFALEYRTPIVACSGATDVPAAFLSKGKVQFGKTGDRPLNLNSEIDRLEKAREKAEGITPESEKSFLAKYWHYLLPIGIIILMQAMAAPQGGAGGGGGGGGSSE